MRDALLAGLLAGLAAGLGGALIAVLPRITRQVYDALLGFSAGVMLATGTITLLWPALRQGNAVQPSLGLLCGAVLVLLLERSVPHLEPHFAPQIDGPEKRLGLLLSAAITLHHIPEGLAIGVAFAGQGKAVGSVVALAIAMQNIPEGLAVAVPLRRAGFSRWRAILWATASGLGEPLAAVIGVLFVRAVGPVVPFTLALAAGAMIFVASDQLIPESRQQPDAKAPSLGLILGFLCVSTMTKIV
ncbi:MAG TPA: ZIP family metal transporter [Candidatus Sulfotelmatobacter sp.]|nr:ZIP family metal transporter [Candidatus Sulfotelmatobacter sp.]